MLGNLRDIFLPEQKKTEPLYFYGRAALLIFLAVWSVALFKTPLDESMNSFLHNIDLPIHETGHLVFSFLGEFIQYLGGTLLQLIMPLVVFFTFLLKNRDAFAAAVAGWWFGQNFLDIAPYVNDARDGVLMLTGGVTGQEAPDVHDWKNILGMLGWIRYDHLLARFCFALGIIIMLLSLCWGGYILYRQKESLISYGQ